jgi:hypothetical protein
MTKMHVLVPDDVKTKAEEVAEENHMSLDELTSMALIEKLSSMVKDPYLEARAKRADWNKFRAALAMVPDVPPEDYDRLD